MNRTPAAAYSLPREPPLEAGSELREALEACARRIGESMVVALPRVQGLEGVVLARWLYRAWASGHRGWRPFVHLDPQFVDRDAPDAAAVLSDVMHQANRGWLYIDAGWDLTLTIQELEEAAARHSMRVIYADSAPPLQASRWEIRALQRLDATHLCAIDPSVDRIRRSLLAHCKAAGIVHLTGPSGSGRGSLALWAHQAATESKPLSRIRAGESSAAVPGTWQLYEEIGDLTSEQLEPLRARIQAEQTDWPDISHRGPESQARPVAAAFERIIGESAALCSLLEETRRIARWPRLNVVLLGETGTGKELLAKAIHKLSGREGRLVAIDLASRSEELVADDLFGHTRGAYSGAAASRMGAFLEADGGTLLLDEIGNLSLRMQGRLLRVLEEMEVQQVGTDRVRSVDVRVIAATSADIDVMVRRGEFRQDLLQRLQKRLVLPPLRERGEDVLLLAQHFVDEACVSVGMDPLRVSREAEDALLSWSWAGNIRELRTVMIDAVSQASGGEVLARDLGHLAPENRRPVPVLLTSAVEAGVAEAPRSGSPELLRQLTAVILRVPPLRERACASVRSAILGSLGGRPIRADALAMLEARPWWGNFAELHQELEAIRQNISGPVDKDALEEWLPHLVESEGIEPIIVLMHPTVHLDGEVSGQVQSFSQAAVLVGRGVRDLRELDSGKDPRLRERREALDRLVGRAQPGCLSLDWHPELSRAHLLIKRKGSGLVVHRLPRTGLAVMAGALGEEGLSVVREGGEVETGDAGEIRVMTAGGRRVYLQIFLFAGPATYEQKVGRLANRKMLSAGKTIGLPERPKRVWRLDEAERAVLNEVVLGYARSGGSFTRHVQRSMGLHRDDPRLQRLVEYLNCPEPRIYTGRLYTHPSNDPLCRELEQLLRRESDPERCRERLPKAIRALIPPLTGRPKISLVPG